MVDSRLFIAKGFILSLITERGFVCAYLCRGKRTKIEEYFGGIYVYHFTYPYITCGGKSGTSKVGPLKKTPQRPSGQGRNELLEQLRSFKARCPTRGRGGLEKKLGGGDFCSSHNIYIYNYTHFICAFVFFTDRWMDRYIDR